MPTFSRSSLQDLLLRALFRRTAIAVGVGSIAIIIWSACLKHEARAASDAKHGLTGQYYVSDLPFDKDFQLPEPTKYAEATRIDPQIAFGQGKGFKLTAGGQIGAWAPQSGLQIDATRQGWLKAVVWRGFIHLPRAGTYYMTTVSDGPSAVYVNQSRVALNGPYAHNGGLLTSDSFAYDPSDIGDFVQNVRGSPFATRRQDAYVVPVIVEEPRDFPIEVRYNSTRSANTPGIDLLWVTPDSPKDASGKRIAKLVPADTLYIEAPGRIEPPIVRGANSTISADPYCSGFKDTKPLTLTFRLADKNGHPVAGKRVLFTTLADDDFGFDEVIQADKPTDQNGFTTAHLRSRLDARPHASAIYATDITDLVDIAQVAHVRFPDVQPGFFVSPCTTGYDPNVITVEPQPLMVGRPITVKTKLENRLNGEVDLYAIFQATDWNIGANTWKDIGRVDHIVLKPGEVRDVSVNWTPNAEQTHQCFKVSVGGTVKKVSQVSRREIMAAAMPSLALLGQDEKSDVYKVLNHEPLHTAQHNFGNVAACDPRIMALYTLSGHGVMKSCFHASEAGQMNSRRAPNTPPLAPEPSGGKEGPSANPNTSQGGGSTAAGGSNPPPDGQGVTEPGSSEPSPKTAATNLGNTAAYRYKVLCDGYAGHLLVTGSQTAPSSSWGHWEQAYRECENERIAWKHLSEDPPAQQYRGLAVAQADTVFAYVTAAQTSMERYRAAQVNGDADWMARQLKAMQLYLKRAADAESRTAEEEQKQSSLAAADGKDLAAAQSVVNDWTEHAKHGDLPAEALARLQERGMSADEAKAFAADLASYDQPLQMKDPRSILADSVALRQSIGAQADQIAAQPPDQGLANESFVQTYNVVNPHDKQETVDLFIQPLSISPKWKVYIANVMDPSQASKNSAAEPKYPVTEVQAGEHYAVTLPANAGVQLASMLVPGGDIGANTVGEWAVEGRIGGEVIGTMVQEMIVPYVVADLQLPPVGSKEVMEEGAPLAGAHSQLRLIIAVCTAAIVVIAILVFLVWRRRQEAPAA